MKPIIWLIILVLFGIGEAVTVGLTSIWFALGALGALIVSQLGLGFWPQIITFIVLSALSMLLVRPFAKKFLRPGYSPPTPTGSLVPPAWSRRRSTTWPVTAW
ncbi:MAG: NfeD family protein [Lawsonibacter sp.]